MTHRDPSASPGSVLRRGFTLLEMIVVLTVISLLLTLAVPRYFNALDRGRDSVQRQNIATLRDAIDKFFGDQGRYPDALDELVTLRYLREVPVYPLTGQRDWLVLPPTTPASGVIYDIRSAHQPAPPERAASAGGGGE
jgi:general secretion pathway protein G